MWKLVNKTGHVINVAKKSESGNIDIIGLHPEGEKAIVQQVTQEICVTSEGVSICSVKYGEVLNLPEKQAGVMYVVPLIVKEALRGLRYDLVSPDSGPTAKRCSDGQVLYVRRLLI